MKNLTLAAMALCLSLSTSAQDKVELLQKHTFPINSICIEDTSDADLQALARSIGESRIVMLGEMDQSDGETIRAKARIVRFLHQKLGFSVLAFQSDFYGTNLLWDTHRHGDSAMLAVSGAFTETEEFRDMQQYISKHSRGGNQLEITGFDSRATYQPATQNFLAKAPALFNALGYNAKDPSFQHYLNTLLRANDPSQVETMDDTTFIYLKNVTKRILEAIKNKPAADRTGFWAQSLRNFLGQAYWCWQNRGTDSNEDNAIHDKQMASNLLWIAEQKYAGRKIIVWADNQHISKHNEDLEVLQGTARKTQATTMGNELARIFDNELFTIGFTSLDGTTGNTYQPVSEPIDIRSTGRNDWYTNNLKTSGYHYAFTDFRTISSHEDLDASFVMRAWSYQYEMKGDWFRVFDGMFYIKTNKPATICVENDGAVASR
jgi:erythromycin esterase